MEIIDAHQHIGDLGSAMGDFQVFDKKGAGLEEDLRLRVKLMKELDISWAVVQPAHGYLKPDGIKDTMRVNDSVAAFRKMDPQHFPIAMGTVEPMHGERSMPEIDRCKFELKLDGLSWHHRFQGCFIDNKWMRPILRRMAELTMVPFIHTLPQEELEAPWRVEKLAREFPELTFVALDAFSLYEGRLLAFHITEKTPNILWDLSGLHSWVSLETWIKNNGHADRFVFSAEATYAATTTGRRPPLLDHILECGLSDADKANILGKNIRRLFPQAP